MEGELTFTVDGRKARCPMVFCPASEGRRFTTKGQMVGQVIHVDDGCAPIGGQCVRGDP